MPLRIASKSTPPDSVANGPDSKMWIEAAWAKERGVSFARKAAPDRSGARKSSAAFRSPLWHPGRLAPRCDP